MNENNIIVKHPAWSNGNIRSNATISSNLGGRVYQHITDNTDPGGQGLGLLGLYTAKVETHACQEVSWLSNIHPETCKVKCRCINEYFTLCFLVEAL